MTDSTTTRDPAITRDAKAWRDAAGVKYTEALRVIEDPLHQGILGDRIVVRDLLRTLDEHPQIGSLHNESPLGRSGFGAPVAFRDDLDEALLRTVIMSMEFLRMFSTPTHRELTSRTTWKGSYLLKHQAEDFLRGTVGEYVSDGTLIWAAGALGLPLRYNDGDLASPHFDVAIPNRELAWMRQGTYIPLGVRRGDHFMPPGYERLKAVVELAGSDRPIDPAMRIPLAVRGRFSTFHRWLSKQRHRDGDEGRFAHDYLAGVDDSNHRPAESAEDLEDLLEEIPMSFDADLVARALIAEWRAQLPATV